MLTAVLHGNLEYIAVFWKHLVVAVVQLLDLGQEVGFHVGGLA